MDINNEGMPNGGDPSKKRKNREEENEFLALSLSLFCHHPSPRRSPVTLLPPPSPPPPTPLPPPQSSSLAALLSQPTTQPPLQLSQSHPIFTASSPKPSNAAAATTMNNAGPSRSTRARRNPTQAPREGKGSTVPAPFPWATAQRATVHSVDYLVSKQILSISGEVQCKKCERSYEMDYDLREKFYEVGTFLVNNKESMRDRAPLAWMTPALPSCKFCNQENCAKPVISEKKKSINWLFLLLGQTLGCCTLEQLKYFCKHTKNHRTGAKDRVLYLTYLGLCKQLDPNGPFDR